MATPADRHERDMALDYAGAMLIGGACSMLFVRILLACVQRAKLQGIVQQHYTDMAKRQRSLLTRARTIFESVPVKLRIGLALGATSTLLGLAPVAMRRYVGDMGFGGDSNVSTAIFLTAKWLVLGSMLQFARQWGVGRMRRAG